MGASGIAVLTFFSSGISVILILTCGIAVSFSPAVCVSFGYRRSVKEVPSWYWVLFIALSCPVHVSIYLKNTD